MTQRLDPTVAPSPAITWGRRRHGLLRPPMIPMRTGPAVTTALPPPALDRLCTNVAAYYTAKLARHGAIPPGVDWSCLATQQLRFVQLLRICDFAAPFSLNDVGCGYGALAAFLAERYPSADIDYLGFDLSSAMVQRARRRHRGKSATRFNVGRTSPRIADYSVASGIMNVKLDEPIEHWETYVRGILTDMYRSSRRGFAVNFMAAPTPGAPPDQLYCPSPDQWARFCRDDLECAVDTLCDYGLREFTLLVRRQPAVE